MQQQQQTKNTILFVVIMALCFAAWYGAKTLWFPTPPAPPPPPPTAPPEANLAAAAAGLAAGDGGLGQGLGQVALAALAQGKPPEEGKLPPKPPVAPVAKTKLWKPTPEDKLKKLGDEHSSSTFHLFAVLDPYGAGVQRLVLNKFQQADEWGKPVKLPDGSPKPLELIPADPENPSNLLFAYDINKKDDDKPLDTLGKVDWGGDPELKKEPEVVEDTLPDGRKRQSVTFISPIVQGFQVTKKYTLTELDYHLGLEVTIKNMGNTADGKAVAFRYQMTGAHGLPVEGRWYTNTFRNSLIGQVEKGKGVGSRDVLRDLQDLRQTAAWDGGNQVDRQQGYLLRYAGVAVQYFASAIVVDDNQEKQDYLAHARPTMERTVVKGVVKTVSLGGDESTPESSFVLVRADNNQEQTFRIRKDDELRFLELQPGARVAVLWTSGVFNGKEYPEYARDLRNFDETQPLWEDDVTVRVSTEPIELEPGKETTHKYLLYNGPVKVMLLDQADTTAEVVAPGLVQHYTNDLDLNTMTDSPLNSWIGNITGPLRISWLLIQITNIMHVVLWSLHHYLYIPYILCIVCLTIMVRGCMFPVSRKQALTSLRMQQLAPELKKMQEKFKEDKQGMAAAQMELYRKHGVNPFGTCWLLFLQMPIFMGLYYSLQESIHFRLAEVTPWWIPNLAAPDMLLWWTESAPFIAWRSSYGWFYYLGPYLNVLPILAVSLMLVQQKWTMPPPTDETQEQQQKMMKYMMVFMAVMFYKVAAGLCIYFIASSMWGFMERQLLPKKKPGALPTTDDKPPEQGFLAKLLSPKGPNGTASTTSISTKPDNSSIKTFSGESRGGKGKRGKRRQEKAGAAPEGDGSMLQRLRDWWADILDQARKK